MSPLILIFLSFCLDLNLNRLIGGAHKVRSSMKKALIQQSNMPTGTHLFAGKVRYVHYIKECPKLITYGMTRFHFFGYLAADSK